MTNRKEEKMEEMVLNEERQKKVDYLLNCERYGFDELVLVMELLRGEGGCPWDIEQTHKSIRKDFIEETYEVIEAIDTEDPVLLREELGDVLLQVAFHSQIEREEGRFDIYDVTNDICAKLIHRHPHVFGEVKVNNSDDVLVNWDKIKGEEKHRETLTDKLRAIPPMLPALMRAQKVGKKASFFDFETADAVFDKLYEEYSELKAYKNGHYYSAAGAYTDVFYYRLVAEVEELEIGETCALESEMGTCIMKKLPLNEGAWKDKANESFFVEYEDTVSESEYRKLVESYFDDITVDEEIIKKYSVADVTPVYF